MEHHQIITSLTAIKGKAMSQATADVSAEFLSGGSGKSATFETLGDKVGGIITDYHVNQQIDLDTDKPMFWDEEKTRPAMQLVISVQTELRDAEDPEDEGIRKFYIKGSKKAGSQSPHDALASALRRVGLKHLRKGDYMEMQWVDEEAPKKKGFNPRKLYQVVYTPNATADAATADLLGTATQAVQQAAPVNQYAAPVSSSAAPVTAAPAVVTPVATPAPAAAAAPAGGGGMVELAKQLIAVGQPDAIIQQATQLDPAVIQVLRNNP